MIMRLKRKIWNRSWRQSRLACSCFLYICHFKPELLITSLHFLVLQNVDLAVAASTTLKSYCNKHQLALPSDLELEAAKPDTATPQGKALNRVLANKHLHEAVTASAPKISPSSSAAATFSTKSKSQAAQDDDAPLAGPSKGAASDSKSENKKQKKEASAKHAPAGTSTFLPSLSGGFTFGDSDNEDSYSLSEGEDHDPSEPQRKNRRGQRARRA